MAIAAVGAVGEAIEATMEREAMVVVVAEAAGARVAAQGQSHHM